MKYLFLIIVMFPILSFSQKEMDYSNVVNDYFNRCFNDPQLKEDGNYLIAPGDKYPVPKNPILYISYLKGRNENRDQAINSYFKKQLNKTDWNPAVFLINWLIREDLTHLT
jgi:hypothetical protein